MGKGGLAPARVQKAYPSVFVPHKGRCSLNDSPVMTNEKRPLFAISFDHIVNCSHDIHI